MPPIGYGPAQPAEPAEPESVADLSPQAGDIVLYTMPEDWHPDLGIREHPAVVLYRTGWIHDGSVLCLDLQVFVHAVYGPNPSYGWVPEGTGANTWRRKP